MTRRRHKMKKLLKEDKIRRSMTKNRPVSRLSLEKIIPPPKFIDATRTEIASSEKTRERPVTQSSRKVEEKPVKTGSPRKIKCFRSNAKTRDQNQSRKEEGKRETKKQKSSLSVFVSNPRL
ncbi:unnamed protein product [Eruca vesicaria subsp. sativa]|uniref:Uncharacterized protein n=1 Tax=Eruca vesicaria subsp. sativa TaxID=29727 RepID=A0ABC8JRX2_ERUVS|nr:unnamed protein product [Eruca vesicaria subsp. sativa]